MAIEPLVKQGFQALLLMGSLSNEEYDSSELIQRDPREISVLVVTNEDDIVKRVEIGENAWKSYLGHEYEEWEYDLFEDY